MSANTGAVMLAAAAVGAAALVTGVVDKVRYDTRLHAAAANGKVHEVREWLEGRRDDTDLRDKDGWTPLHFAVRGGHLRVVELLLSLGAEAEPKNNDGKTPVQVAQKREDDVLFSLTSEDRTAAAHMVQDCVLRRRADLAASLARSNEAYGNGPLWSAPGRSPLAGLGLSSDGSVLLQRRLSELSRQRDLDLSRAGFEIAGEAAAQQADARAAIVYSNAYPHNLPQNPGPVDASAVAFVHDGGAAAAAFVQPQPFWGF